MCHPTNYQQTANILHGMENKFKDFYESLKNLKSELFTTIVRVNSIEEKLDDLDQYTLRNSFRIFGIKEADGEDTDPLTVALIKNKLNINISVDDIARNHRIGP